MTFEPFPLRRRDSESLELSVRLSSATGAWIELNDKVLTRIADGSFADEATTHRRLTATNPFLEGEDVVQALRGNITRPLNVWITADTHYDLADTLETLKSCFRQLHYSLIRTVENSEEFYSCYPSDYTVSCDRPLLHARMAQLKVQLVTAPGISVREVI